MKNKVKIIVLMIIICIGIVAGVMYWIDKRNKSYEIEEITQKNYYLLHQNGKIGVINTHGDVLIDPIYESIQIPNPTKPVFICLSNYDNQEARYNTVSIRDEQNQEIFTQYDEVSSIDVNGITGEIPYEKSILRYKKDGAYGLLNFEGKEITKPIYEEISSLPYKEGEFLAKKDGKYGVLNCKGAQMIKFEYDEIVGDGYYDKNYKNAGYIVGNKDENGYKYSYIRNDGKVLLKNEFGDIARIIEIEGNQEIYLIVSQNGRKGIYKNNKQIIKCDFQELSYDEDTKLIIAKKNSRYGVYNLEGDNVIPVDNKELSIRGIHIVTTNDTGITEYDLKGFKIKDPKYKAVLPTENKDLFITVNQSNNYGVINEKDVEVVENKYAYLEFLTDKYFAVYDENNKIGIIESNGRMKLNINYDVMQKIKGSKIIQAVQLEDKSIELYSEDVKLIAKKENANIYVYGNYIKLSNQEGSEFFTLDGQKISNIEALPNNDLFAVAKKNLWGFEDREGKTVVNAVYENVTDFNQYGFAGIQQNGKWGVINKEGKVIVDPIYTIDTKNIEPDFLGEYYKISYNGEIYYTNEVKE